MIYAELHRNVELALLEVVINEVKLLKTIFLICGRSASGKDRIVRTACKKYGYKQLKSYATRPIRDDDEYDKDAHIFITPEESSIIQSENQICAYTKIGQYEYFATLSQLKQCDVYIIDYDGIKSLKDKLHATQEDIRLVTIYIFTDDATREKRAIENRCDEQLVFYKRNYKENEQFNNLVYNMEFDYAIRNDNLDRSVYILHHIMAAEKIDNWSIA